MNKSSHVVPLPLSDSVIRSHTKTVNMLLSAGADIEVSLNQHGTPFLNACSYSRLPTVNALIFRSTRFLLRYRRW